MRDIVRLPFGSSMLFLRVHVMLGFGWPVAVHSALTVSPFFEMMVAGGARVIFGGTGWKVRERNG